MDITLNIPLPPVAKGRPRAVPGPAGRPRMVTPTKTRSFEASVALVASEKAPRDIIEGPVRVDILAVMPRPKRLDQGKRHPTGLVWAPVRPDADNIRKAVLDGLQTLWRDDAQVVAGDTVKVYAERLGRPRVVVRIRTLTPGSILDLVEALGLEASA